MFRRYARLSNPDLSSACSDVWAAARWRHSLSFANQTRHDRDCLRHQFSARTHRRGRVATAGWTLPVKATGVLSLCCLHPVAKIEALFEKLRLQQPDIDITDTEDGYVRSLSAVASHNFGGSVALSLDGNPADTRIGMMKRPVGRLYIFTCSVISIRIATLTSSTSLSCHRIGWTAPIRVHRVTTCPRSLSE